MNVLPVRVGERCMKQLVIELLAVQCDAQHVQVNEVKGNHIARKMNLRQDYFLLNIVLNLPFVNASFQGSP